MTDKIQMTEEQFAELYTFFHATNFSESYKVTLHHARLRNFVKPDPVQEAEEMYKNYRGDCDTETFHLIQKQHEAIQIMKPYYDKAMKEQNNVL